MRPSAQLAALSAAIAAVRRHPRRVHRIAALAIALLAAAIAWAFAVTVLRHTRPMGLPLDDSYIYLTYAKQIGRGQPFSYFPGGGYSAGATGPLWPLVLAPFWVLGARGHALVWVAFVLSAALYATAALGVYRLVDGLAGVLAGVLAALLVLGVAAFAWSALSGMEVALAAALLVALIGLVLAAPSTGPPPVRLAACLAAVTLSRPEAAVIAIAVAGISAAGRLGRRELRAAAWWLVPLAPMAVWLLANRLFAGHWLPSPVAAKGHFAQPGFDGTYWWRTMGMLSGQMLRGIFWDAASPLVWPRAIAILWLAGAAGVIAWARRERRYLAGAVILGAPLAVMFAVVASSGLWNFQNYRCIAPAFPLVAIPCGCALGPRPRARPLVRRIHAAAAILFVAGFAAAAVPRLAADARLFAQGAVDTNTQVVAIGEYLHHKLPDARVMLHDAGAVAYYGDGRIDDLMGLTTGWPAEVSNHGPGARFEFLESLAPEERFSHFAVYPDWLGTAEFCGDDLYHTPLRPRLSARRLAGDADLQLIAARWDHVGTGERPLSDHTGWAIVDRIDVADLASEDSHHWTGALGRRNFGDPTARWSVVGREVGAHGLVLDGGRTIRGGTEQFAIAIDPSRPVRLVLRTGGARGYPLNEAIEHAVWLRILDGADRELARAVLPAPAADGSFAEVAFALPAGTPPVLRPQASAPYRAFHWFVLQPE